VGVPVRLLFYWSTRYDLEETKLWLEKIYANLGQACGGLLSRAFKRKLECKGTKITLQARQIDKSENDNSLISSTLEPTKLNLWRRMRNLKG